MTQDSAGRQALVDWMHHIARADVDDVFEVGLMYDAGNGWRVYQRIGEKGLALSPDAARRMATIYDRLAWMPQNKEVAGSMADSLGRLRELADEAEDSNRNHSLPPHAPFFIIITPDGVTTR